jgi:hypothetical protein
LSGTNVFQAATSAGKLRGQFYTPPELVRLILERLQPGPEDLLLDPSCGDGEFLVGAVRHAARHFPPEQARRFSLRLAGLDSHPEAVHAARRRVAAALREELGLRAAEEDLCIRHHDALDAWERPELERVLPFEGRRVVIAGNPPYVEAKRLSAAAKAALRARLNGAASGPPDLYLYFLHCCLNWLRQGDTLGLVLPNKVLVNANARSVRERLLADGALRGVDFATRAGLFDGAGVYPVVLYAGGSGGSAAELARVERVDGALLRTPLPDLPQDAYRGTGGRVLFPSPAEAVLRDALLKLVRGAGPRLDDVLDIRWTVSFHRRGLRERFITRRRPDSPHARRVLGGGAFSGNGEVRRYELEWGGWWIDYDAERLRAEGNPLPPASLFEGPKIVICQNARSFRAAYDTEGHVLKDVFLAGLPRETDHPLGRHPRALVGLLCSRALHFFYAHVFFGSHVNGGYLHFLRSFLADVPVGEWTPETALRLDALVRRREVAQGTDATVLEEEIEALVGPSLGLVPSEQALVRAWADTDPNWRARSRVRRLRPGLV